jgi:hypothetical protein
MDFEEKRSYMMAHRLTIDQRGGDSEEAQYVQCVKTGEFEGQAPLPGREVKVEPEPGTLNAKKQALKSYVYEIDYKLSDLGYNFQKIESSKVMLKENLVILETPCPGCGMKALGSAVSVLCNMTPDRNATSFQAEYKKCVCYNCENTVVFIFLFRYKSA